MTTANRISVTPWDSGRQPVDPGHRTPTAFQVLRLLHQPGDLLFLPGFGTSPPAGGARLAGGVLHSPAVATVTGPGTPGDAQTVRCGPPMR